MSKKKIFIIIVGIIVAIFIILFIIGLFTSSRYEPRDNQLSKLRFQKNIESFPSPFNDFKNYEAGELSEMPLPAEEISSYNRLIIKNGDLSLIVENVPFAIAEIKKFVEKKSGFIVTSNVYEEGSVISGTITTRIPSQDLDEVVGNIKILAKKVVSESISGEDVTEEYFDNQALLKNLEATEMQFREILKEAKTVEEILQVHSELSRIHGEIEVLKGRIQYLERSTKLSSLTIYLSTDPASLPLVEEDEWRLLDILKNSWRGLISTIKVLIYVFIWILVFGVLWIPFLFLVRLIWHRFRSAKQKTRK